MTTSPDAILLSAARKAVERLYNTQVPDALLQVEPTRKDFEGDYTLVVFPLLKITHSSPEMTAKAIGEELLAQCPEIGSYNAVKGFLNVCFSPLYWQETLQAIAEDANFGTLPATGRQVMIEFSSPNTNKPLHLGHIRNNLLGWSVSRLLQENGHQVMRVNLVNDRGIHICKSMLAWKKCANGETPASGGKKGDHLVGDYYVAFNNLYVQEVKDLMAQGMSEDEAKKNAPSLKEAQAMLVKWENNDPEIRALWTMMNGWVYEGFDQTYKNLGISFDRTYYESQTYLFGKALVQKGLDMGIFVREADGSVWCDLTADGLDRKLLLRGDGTSVYMTQDLGTAEQRFEEYKLDEHIYVVGNEQNYHFQVLKLILEKLGFPWAKNIYHLSYGMVELPEGKMKSREGTVVDADDLMENMYNTAKATSLELGRIEDMDESEQDHLFRMLSLGAMKYFILKVDPRKTMLFDPKESIDFNGNTGPFIQYSHARICSVLRKAEAQGMQPALLPEALPSAKEIRLIKLMETYPAKVAEAGAAYSPALIANYAYELAKEFNQYYHDTPILKEENTALLRFRLELISAIAKVLVKAMDILGIELPQRM
ncbi:MAG: arginine--tRNA ligase [Bacteroidales bacterium]|nr:arginine--tRNA ligase [Bacteroidales bacterium]MBQ9597876.1 arginine--tRNA ligase [Bacteroidales bacterium]